VDPGRLPRDPWAEQKAGAIRQWKSPRKHSWHFARKNANTSGSPNNPPARSGRLAVAEMQGGVFTLTSLGSFGIEFFNPVINWPESAILRLGAIRQQPVPLPAGQGTFVFQPQLPLSLTFDHRVVDGAPAARFLGELVQRIGQIGLA
jgi:pyruvate/2-oxoglutarate dehydrogenase complex dihydrolipoamide acyltransferase (E2) component